MQFLVGVFWQRNCEGTLNSKVPERTQIILFSHLRRVWSNYCILIMILYLVFSYNVIKKINNTISEKNKLILIGCVTLILLQTFAVVGVNIRLLPTTV